MSRPGPKSEDLMVTVVKRLDIIERSLRRLGELLSDPTLSELFEELSELRLPPREYCPVSDCDKHYSRISHLRRHVFELGEKDAGHKAQAEGYRATTYVCGQSFTNRDLLTKHMKFCGKVCTLRSRVVLTRS
jgi:hypothetical protein